MQNDELYKLVEKTYDALHHLNVKLHYREVGQGCAQPENDYCTGLVVGCECMFAWYWLADLCCREGIDFVLGHALYMKAIHGAKAKNDRIDSEKIARLLRGGMFPQAYVYGLGRHRQERCQLLFDDRVDSCRNDDLFGCGNHLDVAFGVQPHGRPPAADHMTVLELTAAVYARTLIAWSRPKVLDNRGAERRRFRTTIRL